jgi:peptidoglycan hydrolase-like protein with peptidoglycan-binding domain
MKQLRKAGICLMACLAAAVLFVGQSIPAGASVSRAAEREAARKILQENEGSYSTVAANDNGALSVGFIQWHGNNALDLLRQIVLRDKTTAKKLLGDTLYREVLNASDWSRRILSSAEAGKIRSLLRTEPSKTVQNQMAEDYISDYMSDARKLGITNSAALVFYADIANQGGAGAARTIGRRAIKKAGSSARVMLNELMEATMTYGPLAKYTTRRFRTYRYCTKLGWTYRNKGDYPIAAAGSGSANSKNEIKWIQTSLNTIFREASLSAYCITVSGVYDASTKQAVTRLQRITGLETDGDAGYGTVKEMLYLLAAPSAFDTKITAYLKLDARTIADNKPAEAMKISKTAYKVNTGHSDIALVSNADRIAGQFRCVSSNRRAATVNEQGVLHAVGHGSARITLTQNNTSTVVRVWVYSTDPDTYAKPKTGVSASACSDRSSVRWVQASMIQLGYSGETADGKWDAKTTKNVKRFQKAAGLKVTGAADKKTIQAMDRLYHIQSQCLRAGAARRGNTVRVTWKKNSYATAYRVYRKEKGKKWKRIAVVRGSAKPVYIDRKAKKGVTCYYRIKAVAGYGSLLRQARAVTSKAVRIA